MKNFLKFGIIIVILFLVLFPVSKFYFWHDDFSTFYGPRTGQCIFTWPYLQFCPVFDFLLRIFGYNPQPYFVIGIVLAGFTVAMFYLLMKEFFTEKVAFLSTLIYSTFYIGLGVFLEVYDPIISFPALSLLFLSLILVHKNNFLVGLGVFSLSVLSFSARAGTHFVPLVVLIVLFVDRPWLKKLIMISLIGLTFFFSFFITPSSLKGLPTSTNVNLISKIKLFLETSGSWILPDEFNIKNLDRWRLMVALGLYGICLIILVKNRNKQLLFGIIWIIAMYLPYGLRADFRLMTTHRYLVFVFPGALFAWATFSKYRYWTLISLLFFAMYFVFSYSFLQNHLKISNLRRSFYNQLHSLIPKLSGYETLYFSTPNEFKNQMNDFFRVGYISSESALGSEYGINSDKLKLITEGEVLAHNIPKDILTFHYDGKFLDKTNITDYLFKKSISLSASLTPLMNKCDSCSYSTDEVVKAYKYIELSRLLKKQVKIEASSSGEDTLITNAIDDDEVTYWIGKRQEWVVKNDISLKIKFDTFVNIQAVNFITNSSGHKPTKVEFKPGQAIEFDIRIIDTDGQDVPVINEINFIPKGFEDVNFELVDKIVNSGFLIARNNDESQALESYLRSGVRACLQWLGGQKDFMIIPDGRQYVYSIDLPAVGPNITKFRIGCLESYPVTVSDHSD